jgi:hypothetical protein
MRQTRSKVIDEPQAVLPVPGRGPYALCHAHEVPVEASHEQFSDVLADHRSQGHRKALRVGANLETNPQEPTGPPHLIRAAPLLFAYDTQAHLREAAHQMLAVMHPTAVPVYKDVNALVWKRL